MAITKDAIVSALSGIDVPGGGTLTSRALVSEILTSANGDAIFAIAINPADAKAYGPVRAAAEAAVKALPGAGKITVTLTAERSGGAGGHAHSHTHAHSHAPQQRAVPPSQSQPGTRGTPIAGISHIIAVASGKGGVGKSTTAVNLALGLVANGLKVGILDADIYGPSVPKLLGISGRPQVVPGTKTMQPMDRFGLKAMSMGFLVDEDTPMVWRGPMVMGALVQLLREVAWGTLDCLIIDMPPGTGDVQLTLAQQTPLSGAVIVSTPQDLALIDARKGLNMFRKVSVPVLGIIENMSYFTCSNCGTRHDVFGHGGARAEAQKLGVPFLGEVPLDAELRARSDAGEPVVAAAPDSPHTAIFRDIATQVWAAVSAPPGGRRAAPRIVVED